ncbi:hypothetical protein ACLB1R_16760 [Escherichia coli]
MEAARAVSEEMAEIYLERNMQLQIPSWDFQGACLGLDIRRAEENGITPLINTGIAHKEAGIGRSGRHRAGTAASGAGRTAETWVLVEERAMTMHRSSCLPVVAHRIIASPGG